MTTWRVQLTTLEAQVFTIMKTTRLFVNSTKVQNNLLENQFTPSITFYENISFVGQFSIE